MPLAPTTGHVPRLGPRGHDLAQDAEASAGHILLSSYDCHPRSRPNARMVAGLLGSLLLLSILWFPGIVRAEGDEVTHTVGLGETLASIAMHYGVDAASLVEMNALANLPMLRIGQVLVIPKPPGMSQASLLEPQPYVVQQLPKQGQAVPLLGAAESRRTLASPSHAAPASFAAKAAAPVAAPQPQPTVTSLIAASLSKIGGLTPLSFWLAGLPQNDQWDGVYRLTYYCLRGTMSSGRTVYAGAAAADQSVMPLGARVFVEDLGQFTIEDRFAWDAGEKRLDIWVPSCDDAIRRGVDYKRVKVLGSRLPD